MLNVDYCRLWQKTLASKDIQFIRSLIPPENSMAFVQHPDDCGDCLGLIVAKLYEGLLTLAEFSWILSGIGGQEPQFLIGMPSLKEKQDLEAIAEAREKEERENIATVDKFLSFYPYSLNLKNFGLPVNVSKLAYFFAWLAITMLADSVAADSGDILRKIELFSNGRLRVNGGAARWKSISPDEVIREIAAVIEDLPVEETQIDTLADEERTAFFYRLAEWLSVASRLHESLLDAQVLKNAKSSREAFLKAWKV